MSGLSCSLTSGTYKKILDETNDANLIKLIRGNRILLIISLLPCIYIFIFGLYATLGPMDLYKDGTDNFYTQNPGKNYQ